MLRSFRWKRILILAWACGLAFGLTYQVGEADALHSSCTRQCLTHCADKGGCDGASGYGCFCFWVCGDGTEADSICT